VALLEGFDLGVISLGAPAMARPLHIAPNQFGPFSVPLWQLFAAGGACGHPLHRHWLGYGAQPNRFFCRAARYWHSRRPGLADQRQLCRTRDSRAVRCSVNEPDRHQPGPATRRATEANRVAFRIFLYATRYARSLSASNLASSDDRMVELLLIDVHSKLVFSSCEELSMRRNVGRR
jgi:hypothetical protein